MPLSHAEATRRFYANIWPVRAALLRTATFLTPSAADAEDLVQETLMKAFRALDTYDPGSSAQAWLTTILRNTRIDRLRAAARTPGGAEALSLDQIDFDFPAPLANPAAAISDPAAILEQFSDRAIIHALHALPEEIRWTLLLVDVDQLEYQQAAAILKIPPGTVKSRVHRGRLMLKDILLQPESSTPGSVRGTAGGEA